MNRKLVMVAFLAFGTAQVLAAEQLVNQGTPGTRGPWPVTSSGSSGPTAASGRNGRYPAGTSTSLGATASACTTIGGAGCTIIYASTDWGLWPNLTITVRNSGANALTNVLVEWSADGTNFELWDDTTFAALAAGTVKSLALSGNSRRYLRIEAKSTSGSSSVVNITANDG